MLLRPLGRRFYDRDVVLVARELLGHRLVRDSEEGRVSGRIVEVEAYLHQDDPACHAYRGPTRKNQAMFGPPGHAYVFPIHSRHCLNAVTQPAGQPSAVLIRAIEPELGLPLMQQRRGRSRLLELARGPARVCEAFAVDRSFDGWDLTRGEQLWIARAKPAEREGLAVGVSTRIGVTSAAALPLRFFLDGSRFVSGPRRYHTSPASRPAAP